MALLNQTLKGLITATRHLTRAIFTSWLSLCYQFNDTIRVETFQHDESD